jgi:hypothetical protein
VKDVSRSLSLSNQSCFHEKFHSGSNILFFAASIFQVINTFLFDCIKPQINPQGTKKDKDSRLLLALLTPSLGII